MSDVTWLHHAIDAGNPKAAEELLPLVYEELRKLAAAKMAQGKSGQTLQRYCARAWGLATAGGGVDGVVSFRALSPPTLPNPVRLSDKGSKPVSTIAP